MSGRVLYDYYLNVDEAESALQKLKETKPDVYKQFGENLRRSNQIRNELKFELQFNDHQSIFYVNEQAVPTKQDQLAYSTAVIMASNAKDAYYIDHQKQLRLSRGKLEQTPVNIIEPYDKYEWTITGNKKTVSGRTLLEATTQRTVQTKEGNESTTTVQVWYAPEIPVSFGPLGYDGLPGLIMELRFGPKYVTGFTAIEVNINTSEKQKEIKKPKAVADLTEGDFQRKMQELIQSRQ